jgi:hypothetical protein
VSAFTGAATKFEKVESKTTTATVEVYVGDFGRLKIVNSRYNRARDVFGIEPERFKLLRLRGVKTTPLAKGRRRKLHGQHRMDAQVRAGSGELRAARPAGHLIAVNSYTPPFGAVFVYAFSNSSCRSGFAHGAA